MWLCAAVKLLNLNAIFFYLSQVYLRLDPATDSLLVPENLQQMVTRISAGRQVNKRSMQVGDYYYLTFASVSMLLMLMLSSVSLSSRGVACLCD